MRRSQGCHVVSHQRVAFVGPVPRERGGVSSAAVPLRFLEGSPAGRHDLVGADSHLCGALPLPVTSCSREGMGVLC